MPRLYDETVEIANVNWRDSEYLYALKQYLPVAHVFNASNVHELVDPNGVYQAAKDFPNAAPPFDATWVEWSVKPAFADAIRFSEVRRCGTLTLLERSEDSFSLQTYGVLETVVDRVPAISVFPGRARYVLDAFGNVTDHGVIMPFDRSKTGGMVPEAIDGLMIPTLLTFSLLNCRNVTTQAQCPHKKEVRKWIRSGHKGPLCRYHTLNISTMARALRDEGGIEQNGPAKALHICRGHFKDYSKNGLFGKYKGMYYFGPTVRGSKKGGMVLKDYKVGV